MITYNRSQIDSYADKIVEGVGSNKLYTYSESEDESHLSNYVLTDIDILARFIIEKISKRGGPKEIIVLENNQAKVISGLYANFSDRIYIVVDSNMENSWRRFVTIKELCRAYVDHYQDEIIRNTIYAADDEQDNQSMSLVNQIVRAWEHPNLDGIHDGDIDSETFSVLLAIEIMVPRNHRKLTDNYLKQVQLGKLTLSEVARSLIIPEFCLQLYAKNHKV